MSLSSKVLLGLGLGVLAGLFFGENVAFLEEPGNAFVVLLEMTVLPYVSVALIHSLGSLNVADARSLARHAGTSLLVIWGLTLAVVMAFPLVFPSWKAASFFSTSLVEVAPPFNPVALYLPANPFQALAEGVVPAVVVFSVAVGLSLMLTERKGALIESLGAFEDTLQRIAGFVVGLAPYGVFAIAGHAAGTMRGDEGMRSSTIWTSAWDLRNKDLYYHTQHNRRARRFDLDQIDWEELKSEIVHLPLDREKSQDIEQVSMPGR